MEVVPEKAFPKHASDALVETSRAVVRVLIIMATEVERLYASVLKKSLQVNVLLKVG